MGFQGLWAGPYLLDVLALDDVQVGNVLLWYLPLAIGPHGRPVDPLVRV